MTEFGDDLPTVGVWRSSGWDWRPAVTLRLVTTALALLLPGRVRRDVVGVWSRSAGAAAPVVAPLPWWGPAALATGAAAAFAVAAVRARHVRSSALRAAAALLLAGYAVCRWPSPGRSARPACWRRSWSAGVLTAWLGIRGTGPAEAPAAASAAAVSTAAASEAAPAGGAAAGEPRRAGAHRRLVGGVALAIALVAWPGAVAAGLAALLVEPWWVARAAVAATAVPVAVLYLLTAPGSRERSERRSPRPGAWSAYRWYAYLAVRVLALVVPFLALVGDTDEPVEVYAACALVLIAGAVGSAPAGGRAARCGDAAGRTRARVRGGRPPWRPRCARYWSHRTAGWATSGRVGRRGRASYPHEGPASR